jgi:hypothetical protein
MGGFSAQVQQGQTSDGGGKTGPINSSIPSPTQPAMVPEPSSGKGGQQIQGTQGVSTNSATSGQPTVGAPNQYPNTVGQWDNTQIKPTNGGGKGKGA